MIIKSFILLVPLLTCVAHASVSSSSSSFYDIKPATIDCVITAAQKQGIPANVLLALSSLESGKNGQFVKNTNGSLDLGHFQINTTQWDRDGLFAGRIDISPFDVAFRGCYNAELAAWIVKQHINEKTGQDYWTRIANYHSKTKQFNELYKEKLIPLVVEWGQWLQRNEKMKVAVVYK
jgi:hypothetical protein